eukprot:768765-Hanusia_phi.AAC.3
MVLVQVGNGGALICGKTRQANAASFAHWQSCKRRPSAPSPGTAQQGYPAWGPRTALSRCQQEDSDPPGTTSELRWRWRGPWRWPRSGWQRDPAGSME